MRLAILSAVALLSAANVFASGNVGIYGIVSKVVFEPNEQAPKQIQVWGAFALAEERLQSIAPAKRGYLYFKLPSTGADLARKEWADLKAVAGTGQAIAFGRWLYTGAFEGLQSNVPPHIFAPEPGYGRQADIRVRSETEALSEPAVYATNAGIVKLSANGNHAEIVEQLKESLKR
jgi:hypothetical protein